MIKLLWDIYIRQKTRNLTRIPVFAMMWGYNMTNCVNCGAPIETDKKVCPYCKTPYENTGNYNLGLIDREESYFDADGILHRIVPKKLL